MWEGPLNYGWLSSVMAVSSLREKTVHFPYLKCIEKELNYDFKLLYTPKIPILCYFPFRFPFSQFLGSFETWGKQPIKKYIHIKLQINKINRMYIKHNLASGDRDKEL